MAAPRKRSSMSAEHKKALAEGREFGRAVRLYLESLEKNKPKRGRKRTPEGIKKRLAAIEADLGSASSTRKLQLIQERIDLRKQLEKVGEKTDSKEFEAAFIKVAKAYGENKGISYAAWREWGVPSEVLGKAGISRSS